MRTLLLVLLAALGASLTGAPVASARTLDSDCQYALGFKSLHDLIPTTVGECRANEHHDPASGDGLQETTGPDGKGGLLVWRKADNWTAYTDGYRTWINGPNGLQERLNSERFPWEKDAALVAAASGDGWVEHGDGTVTFRVPPGWSVATEQDQGTTHTVITSPDGKARLEVRTSTSGTSDGDVHSMDISITSSGALQVTTRSSQSSSSGSVSLQSTVQQVIQSSGGTSSGSFSLVTQRGSYRCEITGTGDAASWSTYEPLLREIVGSLG